MLMLKAFLQVTLHPRRADLNHTVGTAQTCSLLKDIRGFLPTDADAYASAQALHRLHSQLQVTSLSTSFSGIDTPSTSLMSIANAVRTELGYDSLALGRNTFAVEWYSNSQEELLHHPHPPDHVFGDINGFWKPSVRCRLQSFITLGLVETLLVPLVLSGKAVNATAYCLRHGCDCTANCLACQHIQ
jgi:hypothetical protein